MCGSRRLSVGVHQIGALRFDPAGLHAAANSARHIGGQIIAHVQYLPSGKSRRSAAR
jgi:hypothetical protein